MTLALAITSRRLAAADNPPDLRPCTPWRFPDIVTLPLDRSNQRYSRCLCTGIYLKICMSHPVQLFLGIHYAVLFIGLQTLRQVSVADVNRQWSTGARWTTRATQVRGCLHPAVIVIALEYQRYRYLAETGHQCCTVAGIHIRGSDAQIFHLALLQRFVPGCRTCPLMRSGRMQLQSTRL